MAMKELDAAREQISDAATDLEMIDFEIPVEPSDYAEADSWREFALLVADKLADAERAVGKAVGQIKS